ncbi:dUTP diphosphatase [Mesomycoplasma molare]|nr:dUTP diphosphatase [Mesomycoplasma molare]
MNFVKIFEFQKELDKKFEDARIERKMSKDKFDWKLQISLAIIVEIAEFANELQSFKFWKNNKNIDKNKLLEEWADIIHFLSSCANFLNLEPLIEPQVFSKDINLQLQEVFQSSIIFQKHFNKESLKKLYSLILGFLDILEINENQLTDAYFKKAEINLKRIHDKY